jgi:hypothetical protein
MGRLLFWGVLVGVVWWGGRALGRALSRSPSTVSMARTGAAGSTEPVKACAICAVYVPCTSGFEHRGRFYCSIAHRDRGEREFGTTGS